MTPRPRPRHAPPPAAAPTRWVIEIPGFLPVTLNELMSAHWSARSRLKRQDYEWILTYCLFYAVPEAAGRRRVTLTLTLEKGGRRPDPDAWWKVVLDALVRAGRLVDDGPRWCVLGEVRYERGVRKATRIELEDLP